MDMKARLLDVQKFQFSLSGTCPHCSHGAVFTVAGSPDYVHTMDSRINLGSDDLWRIAAVMKCPGCAEHILGIVVINTSKQMIFYETHYPLGKPDDRLPEEIPSHIAGDFQEALRCRWVDAYNATVEMCRRALESSCHHLGVYAKSATLQAMIDKLAEIGKITAALKDVAHEIRLGGNRGAHPPDDKTAPPEC
jgi:hypothetical protein